jgi:hypothetical protein
MVIPKAVAPASKRDETTGAVEVAAECVLNQSGLPKPVTRPSTSKMSLMAKVRPCREGGDEEVEVGEIVTFSMKAPKSLLVAIDAAPFLS